MTDDLDNDNKSEIIMSFSELNETLFKQNQYDPKCYHTIFVILDTNGTQKYPTISFEGYTIDSSPIITENNSKKYIVAPLSATWATNDDAVLVFNLSGSTIFKTDIDYNERIMSLLSGDTDNDKNTEVIYSTYSRNWGSSYEADIRTSHVRIISLNGTLKKDFQFYSKNKFDIINDMSLNDYNNDGKLDLSALGSTRDADGNIINTSIYNIDLGYIYNVSRLYWPMKSNNLQRNNCYNCRKIGINPYLDLNSLIKVNTSLQIKLNIENNDNFRKNVSYSLSYSYCNFTDRNICSYQNLSNNNVSINSKSIFSATLWYTPQKIGNYVFKLTTTEGLNNPVINYYSLESLDLYSYLDGYINFNRISSGQENDLRTYIFNSGNENSNANISLYFEKGDCYDDCNNLTLISSGQYNILRNSYKLIDLMWTPNDFGDYTLVLKMNSTDNINPNTEFKSHLQVIGPGPDMYVYFDYSYNYMYINKENNFTVHLKNLGTQKSNITDIYVYSTERDKNGYLNYSLIGKKSISGLDPNKDSLVNFSFIPRELGYIQLYTNISSDGDVYLDNNRDYGYFNIIKDEIDPAVDYMDLSNKNIVNHESYAGIDIHNLGKDAHNVNLTVYANNKSIGSILIDTVYSGGSDERYFYFTPNESGNYKIRAEIKAAGDTNLTNNILEKNLFVYDLINVSFLLQDSRNNPFSGYLMSDIFDNKMEYINGRKNLTLMNLAENNQDFSIGLIKYKGDNMSSDEGWGVLFNSSFNNNIIITSELYNKTIETDRNYSFVFANKISTGTKNNEFIMQKSIADLSNIGLSDIYEDYDLYYCISFDFSSKKCKTVWKEANINSFNLQYYNDVLLLSVDAYSSEPAEAFGFSLSSGDVCGNLSQKPDNADNLSCERNSFGRINFKNTVNLQRLKYNPGILERNLKIFDKKISINTNELYEFQNTPADITFKNVQFINPKILYNGVSCPTDICSNINYNRGSNTLSLNVAHFSQYEVVEGCGDGVCDSQETCGTCQQDCGQCSQGGTGGSSGGGGGGGSTKSNCIPKWNCTDGLCVNGIQDQICTDLNKCGINLGKPLGHKPCLIKSNCIDNDKDGYGVGPDCLGPDLNDNDPSITNKLPEVKEKPFDYLPYLEILIIIAIVIIIILIITRIVYLRKENPPKDDNSKSDTKEDNINYTVKDVEE